MRILFIRHGQPDYQRDCLTELGHDQAQAAALRLRSEGICEIYASPMGRAQETAAYTAAALGLPIHTLDFLHEIDWGSRDGSAIPKDGHPWTLSDQILLQGDWDFSEDWREHPYFKNNIALDCYDYVSERFDQLLERLGYCRSGKCYQCTGENTDRTIAVFSHGGSGGSALAHILNLPMPYMLSVLPYDFTSVISVIFPDAPGCTVFPRLELFNDHAHIRQAGKGPAFDK